MFFWMCVSVYPLFWLSSQVSVRLCSENLQRLEEEPPLLKKQAHLASEKITKFRVTHSIFSYCCKSAVHSTQYQVLLNDLKKFEVDITVTEIKIDKLRTRRKLVEVRLSPFGWARTLHAFFVSEACWFRFSSLWRQHQRLSFQSGELDVGTNELELCSKTRMPCRWLSIRWFFHSVADLSFWINEDRLRQAAVMFSEHKELSHCSRGNILNLVNCSTKGVLKKEVMRHCDILIEVDCMFLHRLYSDSRKIELISAHLSLP